MFESLPPFSSFPDAKTPTFERCYNHRTGAAYLAASPAKKKIAKLCDAIVKQASGSYLYQKLGLYQLRRPRRSFPSANL